ncbi:MAG: cytochrome B, partial [Polynucleobacter sp. 35-46-11]
MNIKLKKILIWDLPTRLFHWSLAICFIGAVFTQESEKYRLFHVTFGYTMLGLIIFRVIWGVIGTRYSRFSSFLFGFKEIKEYILSLVCNRPVHY